MSFFDQGLVMTMLGGVFVPCIFLVELTIAIALDMAVRRMRLAGVHAIVCRSFELTARGLAFLACLSIGVAGVKHVGSVILA